MKSQTHEWHPYYSQPNSPHVVEVNNLLQLSENQTGPAKHSRGTQFPYQCHDKLPY